VVSRNPMSDGVNDPIITELKRAYERSTGQSVVGDGERFIRAAMVRINRGETTIGMEKRRMMGRQRLRLW